VEVAEGEGEPQDELEGEEDAGEQRFEADLVGVAVGPGAVEEEGGHCWGVEGEGLEAEEEEGGHGCEKATVEEH